MRNVNEQKKSSYMPFMVIMVVLYFIYQVASSGHVPEHTLNLIYRIIGSVLFVSISLMFLSSTTSSMLQKIERSRK